MGKSVDSAPGEVIDKVARRLRLHTVRHDLRDLSGKIGNLSFNISVSKFLWLKILFIYFYLSQFTTLTFTT